MSSEGAEPAESGAEAPGGNVSRRDGILVRLCDCGKELTGKQFAFCSDKCRSAAWEKRHPRVHKVPVQAQPIPKQPAGEPSPERLAAANKPQTQRILRMLQDAGPMGVTTATFCQSYIACLSKRLWELRAVGWQISMVKLTRSSALYRLEGRRG